MKELKGKNPVYLEKYDIYVNSTLSHEQIQTIANMMHRFDSWAEREINKAILVLHFGTNISDEEIESVGVNILFDSGLIKAVYEAIENIYEIDNCLNYIESIERGLQQIIKKLNEMQVSGIERNKK